MEDLIFNEDLTFDTVKAFAMKQDTLSSGMLQKEFKLGLMRAGRIMDQLEENGVIAQFDGSKSRKVIKPINPVTMNYKNLTFEDIVTPELSAGAILNEEFHGFKEDYLVLHCLLRKFMPTSVMEVGTNMGTGTNIICNALPASKVFSLDLPQEYSGLSKQRPVGDNRVIGHRCTRPYSQLFGDSMKFDYTPYHPLDAWFIDGEHDAIHVLKDSMNAMDSKAWLIMYHDSDIAEVWEGITKAYTTHPNHSHYYLYRVPSTRMFFALRGNTFEDLSKK